MAKRIADPENNGPLFARPSLASRPSAIVAKHDLMGVMLAAYVYL